MNTNTNEEDNDNVTESPSPAPEDNCIKPCNKYSSQPQNTPTQSSCNKPNCCRKKQQES